MRQEQFFLSAPGRSMPEVVFIRIAHGPKGLFVPILCCLGTKIIVIRCTLFMKTASETQNAARGGERKQHGDQHAG